MVVEAPLDKIIETGISGSRALWFKGDLYAVRRWFTRIF